MPQISTQDIQMTNSLFDKYTAVKSHLKPLNIDIYNNPPVEVIRGQIIGKANNYMAVPGSGGTRRIIKTEKLRQYEQSFYDQCRLYKGALIDTPFEIVVQVFSRSWMYDLDNSIKTLLDCLQYVGAIKNDNLCTRICADKLVDRSNPRVQYQIIATPPPPTLFDSPT